MSEIRLGDMVMQVRKHCDQPCVEETQFRPFIVRQIMRGNGNARCNACGERMPEFDNTLFVPLPWLAGRAIEGKYCCAAAPLSWLRKIEPPGEKTNAPEEEKIEA